jgi:hypothetical protein
MMFRALESDQKTSPQSLGSRRLFRLVWGATADLLEMGDRSLGTL